VTAIDRQELLELVDAYALAVDRTDGAGVAALFAEDGVLALWMDPASPDQTGERRGRDQIARAIDGLAQYRATHHTVSATQASVDGDAATGETSCTAHHVEVDGAKQRDRVLYIRYIDTFIRTAAGWRFSRREVHVQWVSLLPVNDRT
jgi:ketosteroid isomerase-like protein